MPLDTKLNRSSVDIAAALQDPAAHFGSPQDILTDPSLSRALRVKLLRRWEEDAKRLEVAENEGMTGGEESMLQRVKQALLTLEEPATAEGPSSLRTAAKNLAEVLTGAEDLARDVISRTAGGAAEFRGMVRSQPITAALVVFAFGYMIGRMKAALLPQAPSGPPRYRR